MTQEDKQILLQDLCARLPYGVICDCLHDYHATPSAVDVMDSTVYYPYCDEWEPVSKCKPYLRPMSSMTEEEKEELRQISEKYLDDWSAADGNLLKRKLDAKVSSMRATFYNSHHLDWNGLIPMGLALESPEGMYN